MISKQKYTQNQTTVAMSRITCHVVLEMSNLVFRKKERKKD